MRVRRAEHVHKHKHTHLEALVNDVLVEGPWTAANQLPSHQECGAAAGGGGREVGTEHPTGAAVVDHP